MTHKYVKHVKTAMEREIDKREQERHWKRVAKVENWKHQQRLQSLEHDISVAQQAVAREEKQEKHNEACMKRRAYIDRLGSRHDLHAAGFGFVASAVASYAGLGRVPSLAVGVGTGVAAYQWMMTKGHVLPFM